MKSSSLVPRLPLLYLGVEGVWCIEPTFLSQLWNVGAGVGMQICICQEMNIIRIPREYRLHWRSHRLISCVSVALLLYLCCPRTELSLVTNGDIHKTMDVPG